MTQKLYPQPASSGPAGTTPPGPDVLGALRTGAPCIMGILNLTPDSFSDGRTLPCADAVLKRAQAHIEAGAGILDIGGESTRPGAEAVSAKEQMRRVLPAIEALVAEQFGVPLSIDTCDSCVAQAALERGVHIVNDVTGLRHKAMREVVAHAGAHAIVMHMRGTPQTMQSPEHLSYTDVVCEVRDELKKALERCVDAGIAPHKLWVDPGLGFAKSHTDNWRLLRHLDELLALGYPLLVGPSRKGFLSAMAPGPAHTRDKATAAACMAAVLSGAQMVRVHNPAAVRDAVAVAWALRQMS